MKGKDQNDTTATITALNTDSFSTYTSSCHDPSTTTTAKTTSLTATSPHIDHNFLPKKYLPQSPPSPSVVLSTLASTSAFASTLGLSTYTQLIALGVSTGTIFPIPTLLGMASVGLASIVSHGVSVAVHDWCCEDMRWEDLKARCCHIMGGGEEKKLKWRRRDDDGSNKPLFKSWNEMKDRYSVMNMSDLKQGDVAHALRVCTLGFLAFKLLGGRFWAISPSSFTNIGSFARASIPATSKYATPSERLAIERLGRATGCHTCGSRMLFTSSPVKFHGDHMPPQAVTKQLNDKWYRKLLGIQVKQRFYPQCVPCSNKQGSILSKATNELRKMEAERNSLNFLKRFGNNLPDLQKAGGGRLAHFHGLRLRTSHLTGGVIGAMTVGSVNGERLPERDLRNGNQKRFRAIQEEIEKKLLNVLAWFDR